MLRRFGQIALGLAYGVYLAYFAPEPQRQAAAERLRQRQPQVPTQVEQEQVQEQPGQVQVAESAVPVLVKVPEKSSVPTHQALEVANQFELDLTRLKLYKLRGESVVRVEDLPFQVPLGIRRYKLRHRDVIKLSELERLTA